MINLLVGPPGGGKSYEAVVFHILPALQSGRKVITNLPLDLVRLRDLGFDVSLVEIMTKTKAIEPEKDWTKAESLYKRFGIAAKPVYFSNRPFANIEDYGHPWRHPDPENGCGPLYVIDECHLALGRSATTIAVEEWFSLHRHESADVLLITQSYGKVSKSIVDLVQICYRVKKATAFGTATSYIRKVQDGVRGEVVNTAIRKYEKKYFGLYKSHTRGGGSELAAADIVPMWKRWPFIGAVIMIALGVSIFVFGPASINPMKNGMAKPGVAPVSVQTVETVDGVIVKKTGNAVAAVPESVEKVVEVVHPYAGRALHIIGVVKSALRTRYYFAVSQNGQVVSQVDSLDLKALGYKVGVQTDCAITLEWEGQSKWIICDAPQVSLAPAQSFDRNSSDGGAPAPGRGVPSHSTVTSTQPSA